MKGDAAVGKGREREAARGAGRGGARGGGAGGLRGVSIKGSYIRRGGGESEIGYDCIDDDDG